MNYKLIRKLVDIMEWSDVNVNATIFDKSIRCLDDYMYGCLSDEFVEKTIKRLEKAIEIRNKK